LYRCGNNGPLPPRFTPTPAEPSPLPNYSPPPNYSPLPNYSPPQTPGVFVPPSVRLAPPEALAQDEPRSSPRDAAKSDPPQTVEPPPASIPNASQPLVKNDPEATPRISVDVPQFAKVRVRVAAGQQPFPDGVVWLQNAGYRTVLHVRAPGEGDTARANASSRNAACATSASKSGRAT